MIPPEDGRRQKQLLCKSKGYISSISFLRAPCGSLTAGVTVAFGVQGGKGLPLAMGSGTAEGIVRVGDGRQGRQEYYLTEVIVIKCQRASH